MIGIIVTFAGILLMCANNSIAVAATGLAVMLAGQFIMWRAKV